MGEFGVSRRFLRDPLFAFFAIGGLCFIAYTQLNREATTPITLSQSAQALLVAEWEMLTGKSAQAADVDAILNDYYQRELLYREGIASELHLSDASVRELIIELMQQRVTGEIAEPSPKDLVNFYADNIERYYTEASISFSQKVFASAPENPEALREQLNQGGGQAGAVPWQGSDFPDYGVSMVRGLFGQPLLEILQSLAFGEWQGPYESRQGWHYFRVTARRAPQLLPFERVRDQVLADYQAAAVAQAVAEFTDARRPQYPFEIAP
ncbi:peptidyl-prolyl cis-trans isomerase [Congregibacter litoralis]|uniref:PPIC-type PPIASE domain protein n=1 Tax=Congregibacter litoralis KT71 TaxID=314285 RepID=A4AAN0_9GAMM|nr:peptidylprolyl isomerase [Congregibacter litoralis]EAQ97107.1 PPIC-type PPIASE domain protein [Congregibacter litoralis KT71]